MPRKRKPNAAPAHVSAPLDEVIESAGLVTADQLPRQLPPPEPTLERLPPLDSSSDLTQIAESPADRPEREEPRRHVRRAPEGYLGRYRDLAAGIGVNVSLDKSRVGIQFDDHRRPNEDEKAALQALGLHYESSRKQWEKAAAHPFTDYLEAVNVAADMAERRNGVAR